MVAPPGVSDITLGQQFTLIKVIQGPLVGQGALVAPQTSALYLETMPFSCLKKKRNTAVSVIPIQYTYNKFTSKRQYAWHGLVQSHLKQSGRSQECSLFQYKSYVLNYSTLMSKETMKSTESYQKHPHQRLQSSTLEPFCRHCILNGGTSSRQPGLTPAQTDPQRNIFFCKRDQNNHIRLTMHTHQ